MAEPVHDSAGLAIIGHGAVIGGGALDEVIGCSPERSGRLDLEMLSTFVMDIVSDVD